MTEATPEMSIFVTDAGNTAPDDTMGGRIVSAREASRMSPAELARRLGVKSSTLRNWETDRAEPRANRLTMLAGLVGVSPGWLLTGRGTEPVDREAPTDQGLLREELAGLHAEALHLADRIERVLKRLH